MSESIPSHWLDVRIFEGMPWEYVHFATPTCVACEGRGMVLIPELGREYECGVCEGVGHTRITCGGKAEIDPNHPALGAYCTSCGHTIPVEHTSLRKLEAGQETLAGGSG